MPRGGHDVKRVKSAKTTQANVSDLSREKGDTPATTKSSRTNMKWRAAITTTILSRNLSESKSTSPLPEKSPAPVPSLQQNELPLLQTSRPEVPIESTQPAPSLNRIEEFDANIRSSIDAVECSMRPPTVRVDSAQSYEEQNTYEPDLDTFEDLTIEETQSSASSLYSRDSASIFSSDSASIYSSASSIYSSGASTYSFEDCDPKDFDPYLRRVSTSGTQYQQRTRSIASRRQPAQDAASQERARLARKAALFKNSRLSPQQPTFSTSLSTWSMVCRAAQASQDCYDSCALTRRGTYIPADSSKDIKAMIVDDQTMDDSRLIIVSIRGTQFKSIADWAINKDSNPAKPIGFLDDEENACHAGFLQVTKAMVGQVAAQLQQLSSSADKCSLLFTGHSAGGAVAALLYSHMLSTSLRSDMTQLATQFDNISCVTFGAPPLSLRPLPDRNHGSGVFLSFANEGDPVVRLSDAAYVKSLAKLMTASTSSSTTAAPPVKVVRRSRGSAVIRQTVSTAPQTPWEELPLWPTPPAPLVNAGDVILLRDKENGIATAAKVEPEDMREVIFGDLAQHTSEMYIRRVNDLALACMIGRDLN